MHKNLTPALGLLLATALFVAPATSFANSHNGTASWYGPGFHGRTTASGETYNMHALTAAHKTLPFGTVLMVTNQRNGRQVKVRINDRGPYHGSRIIDLSRAAAKAIGMIARGTAKVKIEIIE